jgi:thymidylate synthase
MRAYLSLAERVLACGSTRTDRTGTGTISLFGEQLRYSANPHSFPLLTTKKVLFPAVVRELLWMLSGSTNINDGLTQHTPIWDAWADERGSLGPVYGHQWRNWGGRYDQIAYAIELLRSDPYSRRNIVSTWNVGDLTLMRLPPCHVLFQLYVNERGRVDLSLYQRSADIALGLPFNMASYALLLNIIAAAVNREAGSVFHTIGDAHIYLNHVEGITEQLKRNPLPLPSVTIALKPFDRLLFEDIVLNDYQHHPFIRFQVAV